MVLTVTSYYRLGKLHILKKEPDRVTIYSTNIKQFTMTLGGGLPVDIDVEGQVVSRDNGEAFVRFTKGGENVWKVHQLVHFPAIVKTVHFRSHIRRTMSQISNRQVDFLLFSRPKDLFCL